MKEEEIKSNAIKFAKENRKRIAKELTDPKIYKPDRRPISVFMAGSPGAGKTEFSKNLISTLEKNRRHSVIRIDGDDLRPLIDGYNGNNSHLFQGGVSLIVEKIHDFALSQDQSFVLDGTLANYDKAVHNIKRSLDKKRAVLIFYLYQKPEIAWGFTQDREKAEGRNIPKEAFIEQFFGAKDTVSRIHSAYPKEVFIYLVKKNYEKNTVDEVVEIEPYGKSIDEYVREGYTKYDLENLL